MKSLEDRIGEEEAKAAQHTAIAGQVEHELEDLARHETAGEITVKAAARKLNELSDKQSRHHKAALHAKRLVKVLREDIIKRDRRAAEAAYLNAVGSRDAQIGKADKLASELDKALSRILTTARKLDEARAEATALTKEAERAKGAGVGMVEPADGAYLDYRPDAWTELLELAKGWPTRSRSEEQAVRDKQAKERKASIAHAVEMFVSGRWSERDWPNSVPEDVRAKARTEREKLVDEHEERRRKDRAERLGPIREGESFARYVPNFGFLTKEEREEIGV